MSAAPAASWSYRITRQRDRHIAARVAERRQQLGLTQEALGKLIGLSAPQVSFLELAKRRIPASRIADLAQALDVTPEWFTEGLGE